MPQAQLTDRAVLAVTGPGATAFLQGLVTNDVTKAAPDRALYAALLTPQGRYLHDFFLAEWRERLWLEAESARLADLSRRLSLHRLRSRIGLTRESDDFAAALLYGEEALQKLGLPAEPGRARAMADGLVFVDPRLPGLGARAVLPRATAAASLEALGFARGDEREYDRLRLALGVPDGSRDLPVEKAIPLENGFDELNAIDWRKGCYMGQELTARTRYRGLVRKRLLPVAIDGPAPTPGETVRLDELEAGEMRSVHEDGSLGLAMIRLESLPEALARGLTAGLARLHPSVPAWCALPLQEAKA